MKRRVINKKKNRTRQYIRLTRKRVKDYAHQPRKRFRAAFELEMATMTEDFANFMDLMEAGHPDPVMGAVEMKR